MAGGDDEAEFRKLAAEKVAEQLAVFYIDGLTPVDFIKLIHIPKKRRGSNAPSTMPPIETVAPETMDVPEPSTADVPASSPTNNAEKPTDQKRTRREKGKQKAESDTAEDRNGKKKRSVPMKVDFAKLGLEPPPELSQELKDMIEGRGGRDVKLVVMKNLTKTDASEHHERLTIPAKKLRDESFLSEKDRQDMDDGKSINVDLIMPVGLKVKRGMKLKYWKKNSQYALICGWKGVLEQNRSVLIENAIVQIWSFRDGNGKLWFMLVKIGDAGEGAVTARCGDGKGGGGDDRKEKGGEGGSSSKSGELWRRVCNNGSVMT